MRILLLLIVLHSVLGEPEPQDAKIEELVVTPELLKYRKKCIETLNSMRREVADEEQIGSMNRLVYDERLEELLHYMDVCSESREPLKNSRFEGSFEVTYSDEDTDFFKFRHTRPAQFRVGCLQKTCEEKGGEVHVTMLNVPRQQPIHGVPGSECESGRSDEGLCIVKKPRFDELD